MRLKKKVPRLSLKFVVGEVAAVTGYDPKNLNFDKTENVAWVRLEGYEVSWVVYRDLRSVRRLCLDDLTENLIHVEDNLVEVDNFTWEEVYRALSEVVDWDDLRSWVVAWSRKKGAGEERLLKNVPEAVLELCSDENGVDYEEVSQVLFQQGRVSEVTLARALVHSCGGLAGFVKHVDHTVLVRTPGGLIVELGAVHVRTGVPRVVE